MSEDKNILMVVPTALDVATAAFGIASGRMKLRRL
jgi:hypothetical protein